MKESEIIHKGNLILKNTPRKNIDNDTLKKISKIWESELKKNNKKLFDGKAFSLVKITPYSNYFEVEGEFIDYKTILTDRKYPALNLEINQIGVSGLTIIKEKNDSFVLFSIRNKSTTEYPGYLELVPSGNLDESVLQKDEIIDYKSKIIQEFEEETGLDKKFLHVVSTIGLVRDNINRVYDVVCLLELSNKINELRTSFKKVSEYKQPLFIKVENLEDFLVENSKKIVPTTKAIIKLHFFDN